MRKFFLSIFLLLCMVAILVPASAANRSITIADGERVLYVGKQLKMDAAVSILADDAPQRTTLVWESSAPEIATVNNGTVRGVGAGEATITVSAKDDPGISASVKIEVRVPVKTLKAETNAVELYFRAGADAPAAELKVTVEPENAYCKDVIWSSSDESIVSVDGNGKITAKSFGNIVITARSAEEGSNAKASFRVTVKQGVESVTFPEETVTLEEGRLTELKPVIEPAKASDKKLVWSSSDESIVTVDQRGHIKGHDLGTAVITAVSADTGEVSATCNVQVIRAVKKIDVGSTKLTLDPTVTWALSWTVEPADATIQKVRWYSNNEAVATVDENGVITPRGIGTCNIIAEAQDGYHVKASIDLSVKEHEYVITEPGEKQVNFQTQPSSWGSVLIVGNRRYGDWYDTTITFRNECLISENNNTVIPVKAGSETVEIKEVYNNRKVTRKEEHLVFVCQSAIAEENDEDVQSLAPKTYNGHKYQIFFSNRNWDSAEAFCERHGGHLVAITTENENLFIREYLGEAPDQGGEYWIGLPVNANRKAREWVTKEQIAYKNWADISSTPVTRESATIAATGLWNIRGYAYTQIAGFICEWDSEE